MINVTAESGNVRISIHFEPEYDKVFEVGGIDTIQEALGLLAEEYPDLVDETDCHMCGTYVVLEYNDYGTLIENFPSDERNVFASFERHLNECVTRTQKRNELQKEWDVLDQKRVDVLNEKIELSQFQVDRLLEEMDELEEQIDKLEPADIKAEKEKQRRDLEYNQSAAMRGNKINIA